MGGLEIFLGSSRESLGDLRRVASWIEEVGHTPVSWDDPELFLPGQSTFLTLLELAARVDAAVFIFGEDDEVWYRQDAMRQPRDNVLLEYGLFSGALARQSNVIVCKRGTSKIPTDLAGITYLNLELLERSRIGMLAWLQRLSSSASSGVPESIILEQAMLRKDLSDTRDRLIFEEQKARDLQRLVTQAGLVDFENYSGATGEWKLLYDYDYFWALTRSMESVFVTPSGLKDYLAVAGLESIQSQVSWDQEANPLRVRVYAAKILRLVRSRPEHEGAALFNQMFHGPATDSRMSEEASAVARVAQPRNDVGNRLGKRR